MTQLDVVKKFMATLSNHNFNAATNDGSNYTPAKAMLDQAIRACSQYDGIDDAIQKFLAAIKGADTRDAVYTVCGIDTTNADTGGITGSDAGGSIAKTADTTVLEIGNLYQSVLDHSQIIFTGDNGWLVKATAANDTIYAQGKDSINAGEGDDKIIISGRNAVIVTGR